MRGHVSHTGELERASPALRPDLRFPRFSRSLFPYSTLFLGVLHVSESNIRFHFGFPHSSPFGSLIHSPSSRVVGVDDEFALAQGNPCSSFELMVVVSAAAVFLTSYRSRSCRAVSVECSEEICCVPIFVEWWIGMPGSGCIADGVMLGLRTS